MGREVQSSLRDLLAELKTLADKATPGPWEVTTPKGYKISGLWGPDGEIANDYEGVWFSTEDAEFIAAARTDLPRLIEAVEAALVVNVGNPLNDSWLAGYNAAIDDVRDDITAALTGGEHDE